MLKLIKGMLYKYRELIKYGIFGVGATVINIAAFYLFTNVIHFQFIIANIIAWLLAFIFAFLTNKIFVFESKTWNKADALKEALNFFLVRLATGVLDTALMFIFIECLNWNDMVSKVIVNVLVIIINYVASKFWIFAQKSKN